MREFTIDYDLSVEERIAAATKVLPYSINIHSSVIRVHDHDNGGTIYGKATFVWKLFEFPEGTSEKMAAYRIRRTGGIPADPCHMLAFAEQAFKENNSFGKWHSYVIGLGGEMHTVLGAQCGGLSMGMAFFFQHVPQNKWTHDGGGNNRFLAVRRVK